MAAGNASTDCAAWKNIHTFRSDIAIAFSPRKKKRAKKCDNITGVRKDYCSALHFSASAIDNQCKLSVQWSVIVGVFCFCG